jgi:hypothetical protein
MCNRYWRCPCWIAEMSLMTTQNGSRIPLALSTYTVRTPNACWSAAPTVVTTATRCLSNSTAVNCMHARRVRRSETQRVVRVLGFCQQVTYRDRHRAAPRRALAVALRVVAAGRRVVFFILLLRLVIQTPSASPVTTCRTSVAKMRCGCR